MSPPPPRSTLFPYTTLFRSVSDHGRLHQTHAAGARRYCECVSQARDQTTGRWFDPDRKSTRLNSSHRCISYAVFCLKKKKTFEPPHPFVYYVDTNIVYCSTT